MENIFLSIAEELNIKAQQVVATVTLIDNGDTVPFIARYRKEVTGSLDDGQLRQLSTRLEYLRELEQRRKTVLQSISEQEKLTPELEKLINAADTKTRLEDLYLPYKKKKRTKAQIAREAGLEPLAKKLFEFQNSQPEKEAEAYINAEQHVPDIKSALDGAKYILMEQFSENADLLGKIRDFLWADGHLTSKVVPEQEGKGEKFRDYFDYHEPLQSAPSHRVLAINRGRNSGFLRISIEITPDNPETDLIHPCQSMIANFWGLTDDTCAASDWLKEVVKWTWRVKMSSHIETELLSRIREQAEAEAINVFSANLHDLLLAAPAGPRITLALDPGLRTGVKVAVVDATGKILDHDAIFPHPPHNRWNHALTTIIKLILKHSVSLIAIGNGTASRETDSFAGDLIKQLPQLKLTKVLVSEAGASVYSASESAAKEMPDLDVTIRGAVSIARRLQDPLAELVKIDPKSIGVGQYQHDVSQNKLARCLDGVVEDCVNSVGVNVNTASSELLSRVAGLNQTIAKNIVSYRDAEGQFLNRGQLRSVPRLGDKTYEQAAGFLRIMQGDNPLDASAVHPETYQVVQNIAENFSRDLKSIIGDSSFLKSINASDYTSEKFGLPTVTDIIKELDKPGLDPRPVFKTATFADGIHDMKDLQLNMELEGVVTNVTNFGAFVDVGVHQDGLVHISALSNTFVKDARTIVKTGDVVRVKVMGIDIPRNRIAFSMRMTDQAEDSTDTAATKPIRGKKTKFTRATNDKPQNSKNPKHKPSTKPTNSNKGNKESVGTFADLFANAKKIRK